jgi:uncharacterized protein (TIGR02391 family)
MVSLNLFQYKDEVKRALLARKNELDQEWDPFLASWLAYAFLCEEGSSSLLAREIFDRLKTWSQEESAWQLRRNVAPLLFLIWLAQRLLNRLPDEIYIQKITDTLLGLNPDDKFSPWRYPEQVFMMALGVGTIPNRTQHEFIRIVSAQMKGSFARQMLFAAALKEIGETPNLPPFQPADITDILVILWWVEKYGNGLDKNKWWLQFESVVDMLLLSKTEQFDTRRVVSEWELAILYEALVRQISQPDPAMLFDYYPLHARVRQIAEADFKQGNYFGAVFEACKALEDYMKQISRSTNIGVSLVEEVLGKPNMSSKNFSAPHVKLNPLDQTSTDFISQIDEQKGFSSLTIGIFQAFRNPKGHQPKDKNWIGIDPYEALDQLITISLIMKRLDSATGIKP